MAEASSKTSKTSGKPATAAKPATERTPERTPAELLRLAAANFLAASIGHTERNAITRPGSHAGQGVTLLEVVTLTSDDVTIYTGPVRPEKVSGNGRVTYGPYKAADVTALPENNRVPSGWYPGMPSRLEAAALHERGRILLDLPTDHPLCGWSPSGASHRDALRAIIAAEDPIAKAVEIITTPAPVRTQDGLSKEDRATLYGQLRAIAKGLTSQSATARKIAESQARTLREAFADEAIHAAITRLTDREDLPEGFTLPGSPDSGEQS